jgi:hypothetical protein
MIVLEQTKYWLFGRRYHGLSLHFVQFSSTVPIHLHNMADAERETQLQDFPNIFSLKGKVVVVTGGSRGLGLHAASGYIQSDLY